MKSSTISSLFLGLILISQYPFAANAKSQGGLFSLVCSEAINKAECINVLRSIPQAAQAKNIRQLAKVVLETAYNKAAAGQNFLKGLAASTKSPAYKSPAYIECANFAYDGVVMSFRSSLSELKEDPLTANYDAKVASDGTNLCDTVMAKAHIVNPQVTALNRQIHLYSNLAFYVTNHL